jgi:hypothetical protein
MRCHRQLPQRLHELVDIVGLIRTTVVARFPSLISRNINSAPSGSAVLSAVVIIAAAMGWGWLGTSSLANSEQNSHLGLFGINRGGNLITARRYVRHSDIDLIEPRSYQPRVKHLRRLVANPNRTAPAQR